MSLIRADARAIPLVDSCVQCVVTSPPYWGLRDYGTGQWREGSIECNHMEVQPQNRPGRETPGGRGGSFPTSERAYKATCGKCGALRIDNQIGLETTPDAYVASLVEVFAEVWRVLKADGTVWLNLGDSYASDTKGSGGTGKGTLNCGSHHNAISTSRQKLGEVRRFTIGELKAKDLVGIPWRVAFALQQPQYHGQIKSREDRIWLAAMLDAEGCMFIHKRKSGQSNGQGYYRQNDNFGPGLEISNTSQRVVERCMEIAGIGSICTQDSGRNQRLYRWNVRTTQSRDLVRELYPHLVAKQQQARILYGCPASGERAEAAHAALIAMHRTGESGVDFPAPASLFTPGWYLRSDIIWSKCNPMPESVTDRPTKAHEYIFLLAKQERYYYDAAAIEEKALLTGGGEMRDAHTAKRHNSIPGRTDEDSSGSTLTLKLKDTRNKRSVWHVATQPYSGSHFATFPEALIEPCILAGSRPGDLVFDPFCGSGTTLKVAERYGRRAVGTDLSYQDLARKRTAQRGLRYVVPDDAPERATDDLAVEGFQLNRSTCLDLDGAAIYRAGQGHE